jgi:hypothetical protein
MNRYRSGTGEVLLRAAFLTRANRVPTDPMLVPNKPQGSAAGTQQRCAHEVCIAGPVLRSRWVERFSWSLWTRGPRAVLIISYRATAVVPRFDGRSRFRGRRANAVSAGPR